MKKYIIAASIVSLVFGACTTSKKYVATVDDLYYSPEMGVAARVERDTRNELTANNVYDDDFLRMKARNRNRWNAIDDYTYWNDVRFNAMQAWTTQTFGFGNPFSFGVSPWLCNPFATVRPLGWSPMTHGFAVRNVPSLPRFAPTNNGVRGYRNNNFSNTNSNYSNAVKPTNGTTNSSFGGLLKRALSTPSSSNGSGYNVNRPVRTFSGSTSSSAGGYSGGFGSAGSSAGGGRAGRP
jgi:uncharacterized membrane protein YgcG